MDLFFHFWVSRDIYVMNVGKFTINFPPKNKQKKDIKPEQISKTVHEPKTGTNKVSKELDPEN